MAIYNYPTLVISASDHKSVSLEQVVPKLKTTSISVKTRQRRTEIGRHGQTLTERSLSGRQRPPTRTFTAFGGSSKDTNMYLSPLLAGSRVRYYSTRRQTVQYASRPTNTPYFTSYESAQRARRTFMNVSIAPLATSR